MSEEVKKEQEVKKAEQEEVVTPEQAAKIESDFFEDGETIEFYDRVNRQKLTYIIPPLTLKDARVFMRLLKSIDIDFIIINFVPGEDDKTDKSSELFEVLMLAFKYNYPDMTVDRLEEICNINKAKELINIMIGINGLKK